MNNKRMHPLKMLQSLIHFFRNNAVFIIYLFVLRLNDTSFLPRAGRILLVAYFIYKLFAIVVEWRKTTYEIDHQQFHIYRGLFTRKHNRITLTAVQNVRRETPFYFKPFGVTSLHLETSASDSRGSVTLEAITLEEASAIERALDQAKAKKVASQMDMDVTIDAETSMVDDVSAEEQAVVGDQTATQRQVHFEPTRQELIRASFLSLSFLVVIPVIMSIYENFSEVIAIEDTVRKIFQTIRDSWLLIGITFIGVILLLFGIGIVWTFLKYGKYTIASDSDYIYIEMGILSERSLMIHKRNVQAINVIQSPIKKWLGLCEVKLISAEDIEDQTQDISTLFPFMDKQRAFQLIEDLLPHFPIQQDMKKLPKNALLMKMIRIPWLCIIATIAVFVFKPNLWFVLLFVIAFTYLIRYFDYRNTRYLIKQSHVQFKKGGLWSSWFITNRQKVVEVKVKRSIFQKKLGLATICTVNQTKPVHEMDLLDIPDDDSREFLHWYGERFNDVVEIKPNQTVF